jgi:hypothetical protein
VTKRIRYKFIKIKHPPQTPEDLINIDNYDLIADYPAAEFDDLTEFFVFLREIGHAIQSSDQLVSVFEEEGKMYEAYYILFNNDNMHLLQNKLPEGMKTGYSLLRKICLHPK